MNSVELRMPDCVVVSHFGEIGFTDAKCWDDEFQSMLNAAFPFPQNEEIDPDECYMDWKCGELSLVLDLGDKAIYEYNENFVLLERQQGSDSYLNKIDERENLANFDIDFEQVQKLLYEKIQKTASTKTLSQTQSKILQSLTDVENDCEWVAENSSYYLDAMWLWVPSVYAEKTLSQLAEA